MASFRSPTIESFVDGVVAMIANMQLEDREFRTHGWRPTVIEGECRETPATDPPALRLVAPPCP
jgi:hypothetical protein